MTVVRSRSGRHASHRNRAVTDVDRPTLVRSVGPSQLVWLNGGVLIDQDHVVAELRAEFDRYEAALLANDVDAMNDQFWADPRTTRYGLADLQHGFDEVVAWRRDAAPVPTTRRHERVAVTTFGDDLGVVTCEFRNGDDPHLGRQTQVWARLPEGWRVVSAHVSSVDS